MATLTLEEFLPKARQLNPDYTDDEHIQAYEQRYGRSKPVQTVSPAPLTTFEQFLPKARALNPDYSDEEHYAAWHEKYGARGAREKDQGDFVRGGVTAFKQVPQTVRGLEAGAGAIGEKIAGKGGLFTALKEHGLKGYQEYAADIAKDSKPSDSVTEAYKMAKAGDAGALVDWLQYALGYGGGQALQMLATAGIGYAGGKLALQPAARTLADKMIAKESARLAATGMAGEQLAKQAVSNVAGKIGQTAALAGAAVGMEGGEIYGGLVEKAAQEGRSLTGKELAKATGATLGAGWLEFWGDRIGLDLILGKSVASKLVSSRLGHAVGAGGLGLATESGTEFTQTLLEEFGKGNDPLAPESIKQAVDAAAMGGVGGASMGAAGGLLNRPQGRGEEPIVTERTPEEMGMGQPTAAQPETLAPAQIEGPIQPGEVRGGKVYAPGAVLEVSPLPDVSPVLKAGSLDEAIAHAVGVVQGATETGKARAAEFARMTAKAKNETDALLANAPEKRPAFDVPTLPGPEAQPATLLNQPSPIIPGQAFTPRPEPVDDPRARLAEERARMVAQREQQRMQQPVNPVSEPVAPTPSVEAADTPLPSQIDLAYPSSKQVRDLIHEKGFHLDTPVFREYLKLAVGKEKFSDLTPQELQRLAEKVQKIKAPQQPTPLQEAPPQVPLTPTEPKEKPYAPVTTIPEAQVPRSELTPEKNAEILLRAEKAKADMEIAGTERGGRFFQEQQGTGSTQEVTGLKSPTADWYRELTSGKSPAIRGDRKQSAREKIEMAIQKIIKDQGADRGKAVEQVKAALLADTEFHKTEWGRDLNSIMQGEWPSWIEKPQGVTQATENAQEFENVRKGEGSHEDVYKVPSKSSQTDSENARLVLPPVPRESDQRIQENSRADTGTEAEGKREKLRARLQEQGQDTKKAVPEVRIREGGDAPPRLQQTDARGVDVQDLSSGDSQRRDLIDKFQNVPRFTPVEVPKPKKVPLSRTERLAQQKQKMDTKPEPSPSNAPAMESQPATASPERAPAPSTHEAAPQNEPFSLTAPEVSTPKAKEQGPEQLSIDVPPPTSGERPIIARETTPEESPLFSKAAQTPDAEQTSLSEPLEKPDDTPIIPKQDSGSAQLIAPDIASAQSEPAQSNKTAQSPTAIIADALRTAADKIEGKPPTEAIDTVDKYQAFRKRLLDGEVTLDEYREAFRQVKDNKDVLLAGLKKLNKDQLVKISNSFHTRKSESKDSLIAQAYDGMLRGFALGRGVSYAMTGKGSYENAMAKLVEQTTADDLAKFAEEVSKNTAEYKARVQGFLDPKTLEDFDARVRIKGEASLTPEQLARYDELLAQAGRAKRKQAQEQKATVQGIDAGTDLQLIESKHTKTGEKLWVVKLANRVDRAVYDRLNQAAHKLGGRYSSYNKDGAIPGFTFRSEEAAKSFMSAGKGETVSAAPIREAAKAEVQNNAVSKLREMADNLAEKADESLNADRKTNTAKRARQASHAENDALASKALAETMRNLADAIESGEATHLSGLRTKAQVEMLDSMIEQAKNDRIRKDTNGSYVDYERQKHRKAEPEDAAEATFPTFTLYKEQLNSALAELKDVKGTERLRMRLSKIMAGVTADGKRDVPREDAELALEKRRPSKYPPAPYWQWESSATRLKRLESMGITSLPELRAALREYVEYRGKRGTIDKAKQLERNLIGNKGIGNDFFPTPKETAQRMVAEAGIEPGMKVLEPSAGNGNIAEVIRAAGVKPDVVEQSSNLREILEAKGFNLVGQDFMDVKDGGYDRIVMNPPFSNWQDAEHIHHAYTLLKPGGKLVAIAGEGIFFRNDAKATAFRKWLEEVDGTSEKLPEGTFKDASLMATTGVNARMVTIEKPVEEAAKPDSFLSFLMDERGSIPASIFGRRKGTEETGTIDPTEVRDRLAAVKTSVRPYLLGALGLEQLSQVYGKDHAEVKAYNKATQAMEADFTEMSRDSDKVARAWTDLKIPVADKMAQVMEDARFLNFDPDPSPVDSTGEKRAVQEADSPKKTALRERFGQLPEDAKDVYRMARDFYTNMAEQRFQALKERIERAGGTPENTRKLVDRLQIAYEQVRSKVYFPFSRFGENIVVAKQMKDGKEVDREVHAFESTVEAQKFATMMKLKGWQVKQTVAREYSVDKEGPASKIVRQMHDIIKELGQGQQGLPGVLNLEDQLLDSLNQSFLQALPDMSYAKHFIHAKDVKGASKDALRAFAHSALHGAHHISRIRHADQVTKALMDLDEKINETVEGDTTEARQVYNELVQRHNSIMNPNTHPVAAWLGQLGFTMSLGGVVATGITNATQVPLVTYPWMGARYGFGKASAALARAYRDFLDPRTLNKDSLFDATAGLEKEIERLSKMPAKQKVEALKEEVKMLKELAKRGHIDLTQTMDLAGLSSRDNLSRRARTLGTVGEKVTQMLGFTFHVPEVMNRQVTALSTFRLEKEKGATFEAALEKAQQAIQDTHFIYQCVDTDTDCLTESGWKRYDQLSIGERVYGVNEEGHLVEDTIQAVNIHHGMHQVVSFKSVSGFEMVVTGNHRCMIQNYNSRDRKWQKPIMREAADLKNCNHLIRMPLASPLKREKVYGNDFVELMAWVMAEGSYHRMRNCLEKREVRIVQSPTHNPEYVREIHILLERLGGHFKRYDYTGKCTIWRLRKPLSDQILLAAPKKLLTEEFVKSLTVEQMELFLYVFCKADGTNRNKVDTEKGSRGWTVAQKSKQNIEFLQMMATLTGINSVVTTPKGREYQNIYFSIFDKRTSVISLDRTEKIVDTVWCPTTTSGTWIARRGGRVFVTGNSHNRPRYMSGNFLRVLTQFKQYSQNIAYTYGRAASIWLDKNGATKEERTVAKRQLLSMLALQFGAAGALGMPFFGAPIDLLMAVVSAMGDDDDEKRDWEVSLRKWLDGTATSLAEAFIDDKEKAREVGRTIGATVSHGVSRLTPWDMAGRLGQNDLFFREPQREREGRQAVMDWMLALGGPVPSYGVNFLLGMGDVAKGMTELNAGFFLRGVEELTPAVLRHGVKSLRYTLEGVRTRDEYKQLDLNTAEKLGQVFGFTPSRVAEMYEATTAVKNKEHRILNEQKSLKNRFARAVDDQDDNAKSRILEDIRGFNERNPIFAITSDTLNRSLKSRRQHEAGMERGMYLPPRRRALLEEADYADF